VISVGDGWAVAFKMESHNHPSAIEPFQGAATGVGGIIRDIFTMGARPIACLDSLRFGPLEQPRQRYLLEGSVAGIAAYGNCLGVPTVGGEVYFEDAYAGNCLINAMAVGLLREEQLTRAVGSGPGNLVVLLGSTTGRDGIGGASVLASQEFDEAAENKRPAVQVGDPFEEKLLIEACLELLDQHLLVALGDLGAAGLTSSASEMASRGGVGIDIDVHLVPQREPAMQPFEVMVSESQERMLAVVKPADWPQVQAVTARWEVASTVIGTITATGRFVVRDSTRSNDASQQIVADMPAEMLASSAPLYDPPSRRPAYLDELAAWDAATITLPESAAELTTACRQLLASPNICSRRWIYRQYDHQVQNNTAVLPGADAAVLRLSDTGRGATSQRGIALSTDCNGRYCYLDPYHGAQIALAEAARNLACVGAQPAALTDCLNFGSPEKPEVYWTFIAAVDGLAAACRAWQIPVVSGNVSFYNESFGQAIYPTPTIGLVGLLDDVQQTCQTGWQGDGDLIILVGETAEELGGSEYLKVVHNLVAGRLPELDLELEAAVQDAVRSAIRRGLLQSAHDLSEGGLAVAAAECCLAGGRGAHLSVDADISACASLFAETQSRILISMKLTDAADVLNLLVEKAVPYSVLGFVGGSELRIDDGNQSWLDLKLSELAAWYDDSLQHYIND
ncbi:MAG: phosphoribosylformylglycinamidine synthase subunit PurL, partial [Actinomycetia bacterium]|nr:phosphoribosylformylglycinamidine synthase subunit PurL [Actinomycetes bacterium]